MKFTHAAAGEVARNSKRTCAVRDANPQIPSKAKKRLSYVELATRPVWVSFTTREGKYAVTQKRVPRRSGKPLVAILGATQ